MVTFSLKWLLSRDETFRYQMLDRMRMDCEYYLSNRKIHGNRLWAGNKKEQIEFMKALWNSFPEGGKPEWLTWAQIEKYEADMEASELENR